MLRIRMMASGEEIAAIEQDQVQSMTEAPGGPVRGLKSYLWSRLGIPRFRQRLLTQSGDILGDAANIQSLSDLQLVLLQFLSTSERQADELCRSVGIASRLRHLLQMPLDPDSRNSRGFAALHLAATRGSLPALSLLLEAGADPDVAGTWDGATPLTLASTNGHISVVRSLLSARADKDKTNSDGVTPLLASVSCGQLEVARLLLDAGADKDMGDNDGTTPVVQACTVDADMLALLLNARADPNKVRSDDGVGTLLFAAGEGNSRMVQMLLEARADPNQADTFASGCPGWQFICRGSIVECRL